MAVRVLQAAAAFAIAGCAASPGLREPQPLRSQHPAQLTVLRLEADSAAPLQPWAVALRSDVTYSSMFLSGSSGTNSFAMDGEYLRARLGARVGLPLDLELGLDLPVAHTTGGFLDEFVLHWHDWFGLPDQDRSTVPNGLWNVQAVNQGTTAFQVDEASLRWMDIPVTLKWSVLPPAQDAVGVALRTAVELPTGDQTSGFGSGGFDFGFGALFEWRPGPVTLLAHIGHSFVHTPDPARTAGLEFADVGAGGLAAVLPLGTGTEGLIEVEWESSTLRELGFDRVAHDQVLLWLGFRTALGDGLHLEFSLGEDLSAFVAPDFSLHAGLCWRPAGARR